MVVWGNIVSVILRKSRSGKGHSGNRHCTPWPPLTRVKAAMGFQTCGRRESFFALGTHELGAAASRTAAEEKSLLPGKNDL
jgi:hypothetical protein